MRSTKSRNSADKNWPSVSWLPDSSPRASASCRGESTEYGLPLSASRACLRAARFAFSPPLCEHAPDTLRPVDRRAQTRSSTAVRC